MNPSLFYTLYVIRHVQIVVMKFLFGNCSFHNCETTENCIILGYYAASSGNSIPTQMSIYCFANAVFISRFFCSVSLTTVA